jgi:hypothetical protein
MHKSNLKTNSFHYESYPIHLSFRFIFQRLKKPISVIDFVLAKHLPFLLFLSVSLFPITLKRLIDFTQAVSHFISFIRFGCSPVGQQGRLVCLFIWRLVYGFYMEGSILAGISKFIACHSEITVYICYP